MKIIISSDHLQKGGVGTVVKNLAEAFSELGHQPQLFLTHKKSSVSYPDNKIPVTSLDYNCLMRLLVVPQLLSIYRYLKKTKPEIIITNKDHVGFLFSILKTLNLIKTPIIHNPHTAVSLVYKRSGRISQKIRMLLSKILFQNFDYVVNVSQSSALDAKLFYNLDQVFVVYNAIIKKNMFLEDRKNPFKSVECKNILACGRLSYEKNYKLMLDAFSIALKSDKDLHLTILGEGAEHKKLIAQAQHLGITSSVTWAGQVDNILDYMFHADLFWMTSLYEGLPTVLVEALSQGCPILSVNCVSGPYEILEGGKYGDIVDSFSPNENAKALIKSLAKEKKDRDFYRQRAKDFEIKKAAYAYLELMEKL